ncbi:MAG: glycosyltransferase N-terminal domain-containing protein [Bacteroidota bacterium]|nr:glycosyltransferase N-terminal domain-containing protein [Bacteroidota bacterium]
MSVFFYNIFLWLFRAGTHVASLFNPKAKKWVTGRKGIFEKLQQAIPPGEKVIWMHCASLGEFEQGRPVLEKMKSEYRDYKFLLTFFSPSGYEVQKNYKGADWVFYLPMDGPRNAKRFLEIVHPSLVIFVKYEFWYYYLKKIKYRNIPLLLISALFRKDMSFFQWYGKLQRKMLSRFDQLFVQTTESKRLVDEIGLADICSVSGDTRFDRVIEIAAAAESIPLIEKFIGNSKVIIAGSTWPEDEEVLQKAFSTNNHPSLKLIIAPHEINEKHLTDIESLFPNSIRYSQLITHYSPTDINQDTTCLIIDNIGMLSRLYKYAYITYVGGGLKTMGVHNVLEAAVYSKPVLFGPFYHKYTEAIGLVQAGGGLPFNDPKKNGVIAGELIEALLINEEEYNYRCNAAGDFVQSNKGATQKIIQFIQEKRLLTN